MQIAKSTYRLSLLFSLVALSAGCASGPASIDTSADAKPTFDGLYPVINAQADEAWAIPGIDLSRYTKIMAVRTEVSYQTPTNKGQSQADRTRGGTFFIDDATRATFEALVSEVFLGELAKSERYTLVDEAGPDVLLVSGSLLDVASYVPPSHTGFNAGVAIRTIAEATLVLELRDSESGTALARSVDRRAAENYGGQLQDSNTVSNTVEVRRLLTFWAKRLREGLDGFNPPTTD
jgi:hypothetical protein